jgi:hypothetical protein
VARVIAHVAEDHGLDVDRGAPVLRDAVNLAVGDRPGDIPGAEDRADGAPELIHGLFGEGVAGAFFDELLELVYQLFQLLGVQLGVQLDAPDFLFLVHQDFVRIMILIGLGTHAQHHVAVHIDETAVGVISETLVAGVLYHTLDGGVVQTDVQNGVHHTGHGNTRAGAAGD